MFANTQVLGLDPSFPDAALTPAPAPTTPAPAPAPTAGGQIAGMMNPIDAMQTMLGEATSVQDAQAWQQKANDPLRQAVPAGPAGMPSPIQSIDMMMGQAVPTGRGPGGMPSPIDAIQTLFSHLGPT
jgi:hypothetical protein